MHLCLVMFKNHAGNLFCYHYDTSHLLLLSRLLFSLFFLFSFLSLSKISHHFLSLVISSLLTHFNYSPTPYYQPSSDPIPHLTQYDWEAMFAPNPAQFVQNAMSWIGNRRETSVPTGLITPHMPTMEQQTNKEKLSKCMSRNALIKRNKDVKADKKSNVIVNDDGSTTVITDLDPNSTIGDGDKDGEEIPCDSSDEAPLNKLRVVDIFDSIKSIVIAMNAFGEMDPADPL